MNLSEKYYGSLTFLQKEKYAVWATIKPKTNHWNALKGAKERVLEDWWAEESRTGCKHYIKSTAEEEETEQLCGQSLSQTYYTCHNRQCCWDRLQKHPPLLPNTSRRIFDKSPSMPRGRKHPSAWAKWCRGPKRRQTCIIECYMDASLIMFWSHDIMLSNYSVFTCRPLESSHIIQQFSAFELLTQSISSPSWLLFTKERGQGREKKINK